MKIWTADQIRKADLCTVEYECISSVQLMERAGYNLWQKLRSQLLENKVRHVVICVGKGNNGGDGLVLARWMAPHFSVTVLLPGFDRNFSPDAAYQWELLLHMQHLFQIVYTGEDGSIPQDLYADCWIDAIFGTGLSRAPEGPWLRYINDFSTRPGLRYAVDIPSGMLTDAPTPPEQMAASHHTFTIERPKLALFMDHHLPYCGKFTLVPLHIPQQVQEQFDSQYEWLQPEQIGRLIPPRPVYGHKGTFGHVLCIGGSAGKAGAIGMAGHAALRAGAGLVTLAVPRTLMPVVQSRFPELMAIESGEEFISRNPKWPQKLSSVLIGPGMDKKDETARWLKTLIPDLNLPVVLDADALNILADNPTWLHFFNHRKVVITPHVGEFDRLFGAHPHSLARWETARNFSVKTGIVVVLKSAHTAIATPDGKISFSDRGTEGMATGGSGDVLAGMLAAFLAAGLSVANAAKLAVYLHGMAGEYAVSLYGSAGTIAPDLPEALAQVMNVYR